MFFANLLCPQVSFLQGLREVHMDNEQFDFGLCVQANSMSTMGSINSL